ncbi:MAG: hypothetical protein QOJ69_456 [Actinomycetota bacterium]|nr:hypothetical protein [Actinomycetota bacterium]
MSDGTAAINSTRELLAALVGTWTGTYRLWLEPGTLRIEGPTRGTGRPVLDGRFVALDYDWVDVDGPQAGSMLLGRTDEGTWEMAWVDTWHTGTSIIFSQGGPAADVMAGYGPPEQRWGWRTRFDLASPEELVITAWNITPTGEEAKATEATYRRAGA